MGYEYYTSQVFISESSDFSLTGLKEKLENFYKSDERDVKITMTADSITVNINNYSFYIGLNEESYVSEEIREIAESINHQKDNTIISNCKKRLEISADEDFDMDYFNDSLYISEQIEEFKDVFIFDPQENKFSDEI